MMVFTIAANVQQPILDIGNMCMKCHAFADDTDWQELVCVNIAVGATSNRRIQFPTLSNDCIVILV